MAKPKQRKRKFPQINEANEVEYIMALWQYHLDNFQQGGSPEAFVQWIYEIVMENVSEDK